jgi:hypothetical protein
MLCKTWNCKNHAPAARMLPSGLNPLGEFLDRGGRIMEYMIIEYPFTGDAILVTSACERPTVDLQVVYQTRVGNYTGPVDIVEQLPFDIEMFPVGRGTATGSSVRKVVRSNGEQLPIHYLDQIFFSHDFELSYPLIVGIGGEASYLSDELKFVLRTDAALKRHAQASVTSK